MSIDAHAGGSAATLMDQPANPINSQGNDMMAGVAGMQGGNPQVFLGGVPGAGAPAYADPLVQNTMVAALVASAAAGPPPAPSRFSRMGGTPPTMGNTRQFITGMTSDKFAVGYLGGIGGDSQFAGVNRLLGVNVPASNEDTEYRMAASRGLASGQRLLTMYERPNNFNPGLGMDTFRPADYPEAPPGSWTNITWTPANRGQHTVTTGLMGPMTYLAPQDGSAGAMGRTPMPQINPIRDGLAAAITPPMPMQGDMQVGGTGLDMQQQVQASQAAMSRGVRGQQRR